MASPQLAEQLWTDRLSYEALCLYAASNVLAASDAAKAIDLYVLARVRSQYDFMRCEAWPHGQASSASAAMRMSAEAGLAAAGIKTILPQLLAVAQSEAAYDYTFESLEQMCDGGSLKPASAWKAEQLKMQAAAAPKSPTP